MTSLNDTFKKNLQVLACLLISLSNLFAQQRIETPQQLIQVFYEELGSDKPVKNLTQLFVPNSAQALAMAIARNNQNITSDPDLATTVVWDYLRANKDIFLPRGLKSSDVMKWGRLSYYFSTFPHPETFFDGRFSVELIGGLSKKGKEGVYKRILFPLEKNDRFTNGYYLIDVAAIQINGVLLDPSNEYDRSEDLYQLLGFPVKPDAKKK